MYTAFNRSFDPSQGEIARNLLSSNRLAAAAAPAT